MKSILLSKSLVLVCLAGIFTSPALAQKKERKPRSEGKGGFQADRPDYQLPPSPQPVGEAGVAWYTTWDTALAEAKRSNRPLFFMSAAGTCSGVSGIF